MVITSISSGHKSPQAVDEKQTLIQQYMTQYSALDASYNYIQNYYETQINDIIASTNESLGQDISMNQNTQIPDLVKESNEKLEYLLQKMNNISTEILYLESIREAEMQSKILKNTSADAISNRGGDIMEQRILFNKKLLEYNKNKNDKVSYSLERKSVEIRLYIFIAFFIVLLCLTARVYLTQTVGIIETIILISGVSILLYYLIEYMFKNNSNI